MLFGFAVMREVGLIVFAGLMFVTGSVVNDALSRMPDALLSEKTGLAVTFSTAAGSCPDETIGALNWMVTQPADTKIRREHATMTHSARLQPTIHPCVVPFP